MPETRVRSLGREDPLEKEMATHSSTLAWRIPWREGPGRLQSMRSQRVRHDWATFTCVYIYGGDMRGVNLIPGLGRSPGEWNGYLHYHSCLENPRTEEPGGLQPMGLQRVRHNCSDWACMHVIFILSSTGKHADFFHILAIVNNAAMNTEMHLSF